MTEIIIALLVGIVLGGLLICRRVSKRTGQTMLSVLRGNPGEERKQAQRGNPGEE